VLFSIFNRKNSKHVVGRTIFRCELRSSEVKDRNWVVDPKILYMRGASDSPQGNVRYNRVSFLTLSKSSWDALMALKVLSIVLIMESAYALFGAFQDRRGHLFIWRVSLAANGGKSS
jgi:hypothetical protein